MSKPLRIIIAGGGTGGHLFPGIALARAFEIRDPASRILFVGTDRPFERRVLGKSGYAHRAVAAEGIKGRGPWKTLMAAFKTVWGMGQSMGVILQFRPDLVIGVGGYVSGPVVAAARLLGIPCVLHEQNRLAGITNRMLARFVRRLYVSFPDTLFKGKSPKVLWTGNPVREAILRPPGNTEQGRTQPLGGTAEFTVLVIGGSQGAHRINEAVLEALENLDSGPDVHFIHQTGQADEERTRNVYEQRGIPHTVGAFFDDMGRLYRRADLIICRAGATTLAEITALGKAAILIPFPFAADDHQAFNAGFLADAGAAEMIREANLDGQKLAARIRHYARNRDARTEMAARARNLGRPDAAAAIVADCYALVDSGKTR